MQTFLAILFRGALAFSLAFVPVANALDMAAMTASPADAPPCHAPVQSHQDADGTCCGGGGHCHCAMTTALPARLSVIAHPARLSDHPQTARQLTLEQAVLPDTPPPRS
jgi:hypothetical protein